VSRIDVVSIWGGLVKPWLATGKWPDCADEAPYDFKAECETVRTVPVHEFRF